MSGLNQTNTCNDVIERGLSPPKTRSLEEIEEEIICYLTNNDDSNLEIGRLLREAKKQLCKHGEWLAWLRENVDMSICKAQRLMKVARWLDELEGDGKKAPVPFSDYSKLYILSVLTNKDLESFLKGSYQVGGDSAKPVDQLTKRELKIAVQNFLKEKRNPPYTAQAPQQSTVSAAHQNPIKVHVDKVKTALNELVDLIKVQGEDLDSHKMYTEELRELCNNIIGSLPDEELEGT